jgi:hypothetical protein
MARPHSLKVTETVRADGTTRFSTRLMVDGERVTIDLHPRPRPRAGSRAIAGGSANSRLVRATGAPSSSAKQHRVGPFAERVRAISSFE